MNRFIARTGAVGVACALLSAGALAGVAPAAPAAPALPTAVVEAPAAAITSTMDAPVVVPNPVNGPGDAPLEFAAAAAPAQPTAVPLPAGVYVGLFGLASAAVARRRYLKRR